MFTFTVGSSSPFTSIGLSDPPTLMDVKSIIPKEDTGYLDVLGLPFGGPNNGRDVAKQFFSRETDFLEDQIPFPPVFYYHGARSGSRPVLIGKVTGRWISSQGVWFQVVLDMSVPEARKIWSAAKEGKAYASTGAVPASIDIERETGWIKQWLVGELSLLDENPEENRRPANYYAIVQPRADTWLKTILPSTLTVLEQRFGDVFKGDFSLEDNDMTTTVLPIKSGTVSTDVWVKSEKCDTCWEHNGQMMAKKVPGDEGYDEQKCAGCEDAGKCADCFKPVDETVGIKSAPVPGTPVVSVVTPVIPDTKSAALEAELLSVKMDLSAQKSATWIQEMIRLGKVSPAEEPSLTKLLGLAYMSDMATKMGSASILEEIKTFVGLRQPLAAMSTDLRVVSGIPSGNPDQTIDQAYMARMKQFAV